MNSASSSAARRPAVRRVALRGQVAQVFRRAILDAAERVFGARGFADAKMTEIAQRAGVAAGTLYNYFDSKERIFRALIEQRGHDFAEGLQAVAAGPARGRAMLVELTRATLAYIESHGDVLSVFMQVGRMPDEARKRLCGAGHELVHAQYLSLFRQRMVEARADGELRAGLAPEELAQLYTGALHGLVRGWMHGGRRGKLAAKAEFAAELFFEGAGA